MSARRLIVNADDFGIGHRVTDAIVDSHLHGIVSSTTLMCNMPAARYACERAEDVPTLGIGVHLVLTCGRCLSPPSAVSDLVGSDGTFLPPVPLRGVLRRGGASLMDQIRREWGAQLELARSLGLEITHCDSHHGVHKYPVCRAALIPLLKEYGVPCVRAGNRYCWPGQWMHGGLWRMGRRLPAIVVNRINARAYRRAGIKSPDRYLSVQSYVSSTSDPIAHLVDAIGHLPEGTSEIAFHPGYDDPDTPDTEDYRRVRAADYEVVTAAEVRQAVKRHEIDLVSYARLNCGSNE